MGVRFEHTAELKCESCGRHETVEIPMRFPDSYTWESLFKMAEEESGWSRRTVAGRHCQFVCPECASVL